MRCFSTDISFSTSTYPVHNTGLDLIHDPLVNKGTGFNDSERERLGIRGLVPPRMLDMATQETRIMRRYNALHSGLEKHVFLQDLRDRNEVLFFKILMDNIESMARIIYTPVVGEACQKFGLNFQRARGMYFSVQDRGHMAAMAYNWPRNDVDVIVVTDGSRILGLGDLGVNGMGIPIGKLALYVAAGGIHPSRVLPIMLDVGTDNVDLLNDPGYLGTRAPRLRGKDYFDMVDEFMQAIHARWPNALVQFEDFGFHSAAPILAKYKMNMRCFNDDIQGTGAVALAGVFSALRMQGKTAADLPQERFLFLGAGSAGVGVADSIRNAIVRQGVQVPDSYKNFHLIDQFGLVGQSRPNLAFTQIPFARPDLPDGMSILEVIKIAKPTFILGLSGAGPILKKDAIAEMAKHVQRPVIFPLSNPTSRSECTAEEAIEWSEGRAIVATGSPSENVEYNGKTHYIGQSNNMFIFPGIGLGATLCQASRISGEMFYRSAQALADSVTAEELQQGRCYPSVTRIRAVSKLIAIQVCKVAAEQNLARRDLSGEFLESLIDKKMFVPKYEQFVAKKPWIHGDRL